MENKHSIRFDLLTHATQMSFIVNDDKKLIRTYYGSRLFCPEQADAQATSALMAYPSAWDSKMTECAVSITQPDGNVSLDLVYESHELGEPENGNQLLCVTLRDSYYPISVLFWVLAHEESDVIEQWVEIRNEGDGAVSVDQAASGVLYLDADQYYITSFRGAWAGESLMREERLEKGNLLEVSSFTGTKVAQEGSPGFIVAANHAACEDGGAVYMGALAWSGNYRLRFKHRADNALFATFGVDFLQSPYRLDAGKTLVLPKLILTHSLKGKGQACRQLHRWARKFGIRGGGEERMTLLNSWEGAYFSFDEPLLHQMMQRAADIGVELFVLDDGWFGNKHRRNHDRAGLGDWSVNTSKLPNGIGGLTDESKRCGIKFGIWVEPEMINPQSELYEQHPDWVIRLPHRPNREERNQLVLDLANPDVRDYIIQFMDSLLTANPGIAYVKWDCNRTISNPGSSYLSPAHQKNLYVDYVKGYYSVLTAITQKHPDVIFQNCSAGGGRTDYGAMQHYHEFWVSDNTDPCDRLMMQWGIGHLFPAIAMASHVTESPNHQTKRESPLKFRFDVAMSARLGFELQPGRMSPEDVEYSKAALAEYKRIRPIIQFGDLYRLRSPYEGNTCSLMYTYGNKAVVFAYLLNKGYADSPAPIRLKGLKRESTYLVRELSLDQLGACTSLHEQTIGGDYLMDNGIKFLWKRTLQSSVIELIES